MTSQPPRSAESSPGRSRRPVLLAAAAAVAAVAAVGVWSLGGEEPVPTATAPSPTESAAPAPVELALGEAPAAKCMVPSAESIAAQEVAFAGTVAADDAGAVTLDVDRWYAAPDDARPETVTVREPSADLRDLLLGVDLRVGASYLVSATDGQVSLCGLSGERTPELEALYAEAFSG